jgi:hypothetical protein
MSKQKLIIPTIFIVIAAALAIWGYIVFKNRYSGNETGKKIININTENTSSKNESSGENSGTNLPDGSQSDTSSSSATENPPFVEIKREDCLNNCKRFSKDQELTYCKQSCGLMETQNNTDNCSEKSDLEKDYCFKDLAIKERDFKICEKISDKGIKKICVTRITEDLLDEQAQNPSTLPE